MSENNPNCTGIDLNRNWDIHWNEGNGTGDPCTYKYGGVKAFSELETKHTSDFIMKNNDHIKFANTLHAYGQYILLPWGYKKENDDVPNLKNMTKLVEKVRYYNYVDIITVCLRNS